MAPPRSVETVWRIRYVAVCVVLVGLAFNSASGQVVPDTKLDLSVRPLAFLARALHMWDPQGAAGQVQNQAYGYLFPMGPFFALGHAAQLPAWAVQRLWWSALLCVAFAGVVALARRLRIGTPASGMVAGLAYALSPHVLSVLGPVSAEALPMCLAPWVLVPLVTGVREGSPRRAAMRSGVAVLFMGAINAALVLAALIPAALWLVTRRPGPRTRQLAGAWVLAVALAALWWIVALLLLGHYSVPFLDHIESAVTTTSTTTLTESLRGTSDWVAYLPTSGWHAGWLLLTEPTLIINSVVVVALGLAGLAARSVPVRGWLTACLLTGVVLMCAAYVGGVDGLAAGSARSLLDGAWAPLRNVHKFDVALRLPLVLGLAHLVGRLRWGVRPGERRLSRVLVLIVAAGAVAGTATPLLALRIAPVGAFGEVPGYWQQAANWLGRQHATGRALLLPGSRFGQYLWGYPGDEPMQPLAESPWDVRNAVPLSDAGHVRMLDAVDEQLAAGRPSAGLASYLARSGVQFLVVRNDLDQLAAQVPRPVVVHAALAASPGLSLAQSFGPLVGQGATPFGTYDQHLQLPYRAVEIWSVAGPPERRVEAVPNSAVVLVSGGPESLLPISDDGLPAEQATVLTGDVPAGYRAGEVVLTDGLRRREDDVGSSPLDTSATLTLDDPRRMAATARDYLPFSGDRHQSHAQLIGVAAIRASSSASDPDSFGGSVHSAQPFAAFDRDGQTAWSSNPATAGVGQWLEVDFATARALSSATITFAPGSSATRVQVRTDAGTASTDVSGTAPIAVHVPIGMTRTLRLTVTRTARGRGPFHPVGVAELSIPGVHVQRTIVMPQDLAPGTPVSAVDMSVPNDARPGCTLVDHRPLCAVGVARLGEETTGLDRSFTLPSSASYALSLTAEPRAGPALDALVHSALHPRIAATASSQAIADPLAGPQTAVDVDLGTGWIASTADPAPSLTLAWAAQRTISALTVVTDPLLAATPPDRVTITSAAGTRSASIGPGGAVSFRALRTDKLTLALSSSTGLRANVDPGGQVDKLGIGVSEVAINGVHSTARAATDTIAVHLPCGSGPNVDVDGVIHQTAVDTTIAALRELRRVPMVSCDATPLALGTGSHRVQAPSTDTWLSTAATLDSSSDAITAPAPPATIRHWGSTDRSVAVGARASRTLLVVHENANTGWRASFEGHPLTRITVDGWEQGYLVPAGAAGLVQLRYWPDTLYRGALLGGLVAVLLLLIGAALPPRRQRVLAPARPSNVRAGAVAIGACGLATALLTCGALGALAWVGVTAGAAIAVAATARTPGLRNLTAAMAAGCYLAAGVELALRHWGASGYAGGSGVLQLLSLCALLFTAWTPLGGAASGRVARSAVSGEPDAVATSPEARSGGN